MKTIIFVCHGNICRSPAAEYIFKKIIKENHLENDYLIFSRALSNEEIGNDIYPPMKEELRREKIPLMEHYAKKLTHEECQKADYIFYMDESNKRILEYQYSIYLDKCQPIFINTPDIKNIEDPWYTRRFYYVLKQIEKCLLNLLKII